jgi:hypothetical protein
MTDAVLPIDAEALTLKSDAAAGKIRLLKPT